MNSVYSLLLTVILVEYCVMFPLDNFVALSNTHTVKKARSVDDKTNELLVGNCTPDDPLIHAETIVVNNDGRSRLTGNIRVNVEAPVNITCVKLVNQADNASGVLAHLVEGGVGHNYVVFGVDTAFGQSINYFVQIFGA